jgi:hypothetical protein
MSALPITAHLENSKVLAAPLRIPDSALSPSLGGHARGRGAAFEVKFLLSENTAAQIEAALRSQMRLDPYADPETGNAYSITSIYLDTPRFDVFHRLGRHRFRKFRIRRYGEADWYFLERKTKRKVQVRKHRSKAEAADVARLGAPLVLTTWDGAWFHRQVTRWSLAPTCQVTYLRRAYFAEVDASPIRLTFDRELRARRMQGWASTPATSDVAIGEGEVICEFKFRGAMPACFREVVEDFGIAARGASKYRRSLEALGVVRSTSHAG